MPNFWTKTTQFIGETLNGPRTKDEDFTNKFTQIKNVEKGIMNIANLIREFERISEQFKLFTTKLSEAITTIIQQDNNARVAKLIAEKYDLLTKHYNTFISEVKAINTPVESLREDIRSLYQKIEKREELRRVYDHYDEKMEKLKAATKKDKSYMQRNEEKYNKAKNDYSTQAHDTSNAMKDFMNNRFNAIKPILLKFMTAENKFYTNIYNVILSNKDIGATKSASGYVYNKDDDWFYENKFGTMFNFAKNA